MYSTKMKKTTHNPCSPRRTTNLSNKHLPDVQKAFAILNRN